MLLWKLLESPTERAHHFVSSLTFPGFYFSFSREKHLTVLERKVSSSNNNF